MRLSPPARTILIGGLGLVAVLWTLLGTLLTVTDSFFVRLGGTPEPDEAERVYGLYQMATTILVATIGIGAGRRLARTAAPALHGRKSRQSLIGWWFVGLNAIGGLITVMLLAFRTIPLFYPSGANP